MLYLHGLGHFHPEAEVTNRFLQDLDIGTTDDWIVERVGIRSRRTVLPLDYIRATRNRDPRMGVEAAQYSNAEMGRRAAELAITRAGIAKDDIGMVIAGSSAPDTASPAEACNVARALGVEVPAFDINSACSSFFAQVHVLSLMEPGRLPEFVLLVVPEGMTRTVDYGDRSTAVLWGDGAAAAVVSTREPARARILGNTFASSPAGNDQVRVPRLGHFQQNGHVVQMFAVKKTTMLLTQLRDRFQQDGRTLHFIGHQANLRMLESVCRRCEVPPEQHHSNVEWFGNTGAASAPSVISMAWQRWTDRDDIAVVGVGSGLTWASFLMRFEAAA
jgi:3-oxoacyl-[acyl-carrier-protein] synthase-3